MLASVAMARRGWQLVAVFVLALAVVGMHSLGAGHHGATTTVGHGSHLTAGAEVRDLQEGLDTVEEKARLELGMVKPNEIYVQVGP